MGIENALPTGMGESETFDVFLVLKPFRQIIPELKILVAPFQAAERCLASAEGYYAPSMDCALIALRFSPRAGTPEQFKQAASDLGLPIIVPTELSFEKRCEFFLDHLSRYTTYVQQFRGPGSLLGRIVEDLAAHEFEPARAHIHTPAPRLRAASAML